MKKIIRFILITFSVLILVSCNNSLVNTEDEMQRVIEGNLDLDIDIIGKIDLDDVILVCYITEDGNETPRYGYSEFQKNEDGYLFIRDLPTMDRGKDFRSAIYDNSYIFISNNKNGKKLRIRYSSGEEELIIITEMPFVYYLEDVLLEVQEFEYHLLDEKGKEISL